jgi:hypothetical protein
MTPLGAVQCCRVGMCVLCRCWIASQRVWTGNSSQAGPPRVVYWAVTRRRRAAASGAAKVGLRRAGRGAGVQLEDAGGWWRLLRGTRVPVRSGGARVPSECVCAVGVEAQGVDCGGGDRLCQERWGEGEGCRVLGLGVNSPLVVCTSDHTHRPSHPATHAIHCRERLPCRQLIHKNARSASPSRPSQLHAPHGHFWLPAWRGMSSMQCDALEARLHAAVLSCRCQRTWLPRSSRRPPLAL